MTTGAIRDIPDDILDAAFGWAVTLSSGTVGNAEQRAFERWLHAAPLHQVAWRRIQIVEQEFAAIRGVATQGLRVLDHVQRVRQRRRLKQLVGTVLSLVLIAGLLLIPLRQLWQGQYLNSGDQPTVMELAGGARVHLDGRTAFDIESTDGVLVLQLHRGRILIDSSTAAPADKPQVVAGGARFTPVGTRFVVTVESSDTSELAVVQGEVHVDAGMGASVRVRAGERQRVTRRAIEPLTSDGLLPGAWADGVVEADNARLDDVLVALGRHHRGWLRCDPAIAPLRVTGLFHLDDIDGALRALGQSLPVRIERTTDWWINVQAAQ